MFNDSQHIQLWYQTSFFSEGQCQNQLNFLRSFKVNNVGLKLVNLKGWANKKISSVGISITDIGQIAEWSSIEITMVISVLDQIRYLNVSFVHEPILELLDYCTASTIPFPMFKTFLPHLYSSPFGLDASSKVLVEGNK